MSLFVGLGATASADTTTTANYTSYTVQSGDWLSKICTRYGLNYWTAKDAIMILNGFTSTTQCDKIVPGQVIKLPISNEAAAAIKASGSATTTTTTTTTGSTTSTTTTTTSTVENLNYNDWVAGYLVAHTMTSGESLYSVCNSLGVSYTNTVAKIVAINGLSNPNNVWVGKTIYVPVSTRPSSGTYYVVVGHTVVAGDTMAALCSNYGVSFTKNYTMLEGLNGTTNLNRILTGYTVYIPALSSVVVKTVTTTNTNTTTNTSTNTNTNTSSGYDIYFTSTSDGAPYATVSGSKVTKAEAGKTVTIVPDANYGYTQESVVVSTTGGSRVSVTNNTFIMPSSSVTITLTYTAAKQITVGSAANGTVKVYSGGIEAKAAAMGSKINVVATPANGYQVETVTYSYYEYAANGTATQKTVNVPAKNGEYVFAMPDAAVKVNVTFAKTDLWAVKTATVGSGSVTANIDGTNIVKASAGQTIYVKTSAQSGYTLKSVEVYNSANGLIDYDKTTGTFKMPACPVTIKATFVSSTEYAINTVVNLNGASSTAAKAGSVTYQVDGKTVTKAKEGDVVSIIPNAKSGNSYDSDYVSVKFTNGTSNVTSVDKIAGTFIMPGTSVNVNVNFVSGAYTIKKASTTHGSFTVSTNGNAYNVTTAQPGDAAYIYVKPDQNYEVDKVTYAYKTSKDAKSATAFEITSKTGDVSAKTAGKLTDATTGDTYWYFPVPSADEMKNSDTTITVTVTFKLAEIYKITSDITVNDADGNPMTITDPSQYVTVKYLVKDIDVKDNCVAGSEVTISITPVQGYRVIDGTETTDAETDKPYVKYTDAKGNPDTEVKLTTVTAGSTYKFTMPVASKADGLTVSVKVEPGPYTIVTNNDHGAITITDGTKPLEEEPKYGQTVTAEVEAFSGYEITGFKVVDGYGYTVDFSGSIATGGATATYTFTMPDSDVIVVATYEKKTDLKITTASGVENGTVSYKVNGNAATTAGYGDTVVVVPSPNAGYIVKEVTTSPKTKVATLTNGSYSFTMPSEDVKVTVTFEAGGEYNINLPTNVLYKVTSSPETKAVYGTTVTVTVTPEKGVVISKIIASSTKDSTGSKVLYSGTVKGDQTGTFDMPASDVTITVETLAEEFTIVNDCPGYVTVPSSGVVGHKTDFEIKNSDDVLVTEVKTDTDTDPIYTFNSSDPKTTGSWTSAAEAGDTVTILQPSLAYRVKAGTVNNGKISFTGSTGDTYTDMYTYNSNKYAVAEKTVTVNLQPNQSTYDKEIYQVDPYSIKICDVHGNVLDDYTTHPHVSTWPDSSDASFDFTMPTADEMDTYEQIVVSMNFVKAQAYAVTVNDNKAQWNATVPDCHISSISVKNGNANVTLNDASATTFAVASGKSVTITVKTIAGWYISTDTINSGLLGTTAGTWKHTADNTWTFTFTPTADVTIDVASTTPLVEEVTP